jgi:putative hydrolase of the HAD superfamily
MGHSTDRFPASCVQAYHDVCAMTGRASDAIVAAEIDATARTAFTKRAPLMPGALETLLALRDRGVKLALLTKGDPAVQRRRVAHSGLGSLFDVVEIVDQKTPEAFVSLLNKLGVPASAALSVGNSVRSDLLPSLDAGLEAVWIDTHVWEYERTANRPDSRVIAVEDLRDVLEMTSST